jgi:AcrR family transcriptional regulator
MMISEDLAANGLGSKESSPRRPKRHAGNRARTASRPDRKGNLVRLAYRALVAKGFEGLRIREVAAAAGINNATLHYYFPHKEDLIQGVVDYLLEEFKTRRAPERVVGQLGPKEELAREFEETRLRLSEAPEMYVVLTELAARSLRDPAIARILRKLEGSWRSDLGSILQRGVDARVFRPDIDLDATATAIMVQLKGIAYHAAMIKPRRAEVDRLVAQLATLTEFWLTR